jgi:hypothetical protein
VSNYTLEQYKVKCQVDYLLVIASPSAEGRGHPQSKVKNQNGRQECKNIRCDSQRHLLNGLQCSAILCVNQYTKSLEGDINDSVYS